MPTRDKHQYAEAEAIVTYVKFLVYIEKYIENYWRLASSILRRLQLACDKIIIKKYCPEDSSLGQILRVAKNNFNYQLDKNEMHTVYFWLIRKYPEQKKVILALMLKVN